MKKLIRANEIFQKVESLSEDIKSLENDLKNVIEGDLTLNVGYEIKNKTKKEDILDEDGSLISHEIVKDFIYDAWESYSRAVSQTNNQIENKSLNPTEFVITFSAFLTYKKQQRKKLVDEFKELELKLKLK